MTKLKKDPYRIVLTAHMGVVLVIMNTEDYIKKAEDLLKQHTYRVMASDPTMRLKNKLITLLKSIKAKGGIKEELYKRALPYRGRMPQILWAPKDTQGGDAIKIHSIKHWDSHL